MINIDEGIKNRSWMTSSDSLIILEYFCGKSCHPSYNFDPRITLYAHCLIISCVNIFNWNENNTWQRWWMLLPIHEVRNQLTHSKIVLQKYGIIRSLINDDYNVLNLAQNHDYSGADVESIGAIHAPLATNKIEVDSHTSVCTSPARQSLCRLPDSSFLNKLLDICQVVIIVSIIGSAAKSKQTSLNR